MVRCEKSWTAKIFRSMGMPASDGVECAMRAAEWCATPRSAGWDGSLQTWPGMLGSNKTENSVGRTRRHQLSAFRVFFKDCVTTPRSHSKRPTFESTWIWLDLLPSKDIPLAWIWPDFRPSEDSLVAWIWPDFWPPEDNKLTWIGWILEHSKTAHSHGFDQIYWIRPIPVISFTFVNKAL